MTNLLKKLLLVAMALILAFSVVGCKNKKGQSEEEESKKPPVAEESLPAVTDPVVPVDGVDVSGALDALAPILNNAYTSIVVDVDADVNIDGQEMDAVLDGAIYIKMTGKGYDIVAEMTASYSMYGESESAAMKFWYIDGQVVLGVSESGLPMEYAKMQVGNVNELLSQLNAMIAADEEIKEQYELIMPMVDNLLAVIEEEGITKTAINETIDLKAMYEQTVQHVLNNKDMDMYSWLLTNVLGVNAQDPNAVATFENSILAVTNGNPTVAVALDRAVALINTYLPADGQVSLRTIVDELQAISGLTTAQIVDYFNHAVFYDYEYDEVLGEYVLVYNEEDFLPMPEAGVSLYDYAYAILNTYQVDTLIYEMGYDSAQEMWNDCKAEMLDYTLGEVANDMLQSYFGGGSLEYVYTPGAGYYSYDAYYDSYYYTGYGADYTEQYVPMDYISLLSELNMTIDNYTVSVRYTPDSKGRPTLISYAISGDMGVVDPDQIAHTVVADSSIKVTFSYTKPSISFAIPSDVLAQAQDLTGSMSGGAVIA